MKKFSFLGAGFEYFKIWIVNILLTIVTLGLYYPWAKVRNNKYFYGNAVLDNRAFDYHATGKQLFFGYVIAFLGVIIFLILKSLFISLSIIFSIIFMALIPLILLRSIKFNMFMTSFDNVRFKFDGKLSTMYMIVFVLPILMVLGATFPFILLGFFLGKDNISTFTLIIGLIVEVIIYIIIFSYIVLKKNEYYYNNLSYGKSKFKIDLQLNDIRKIVLKTAILGLGTIILSMSILLGIFSMALEISMSPQLSFNSILEIGLSYFKIFIPIMYFILILEMLLVSLYYQVKIREYIYSKLILDDKIKFASTLKVSSYLGLVFSNLLLIIVTLGLAIPWVKVRLARYTLENTQVSSEIDLDIYLSQKQEALSAIGEEIAEFTNLEMGFTV